MDIKLNIWCLSSLFGDRAKIGLIVPATNTIMEPEINSMTPVGVSIHSARLITDIKPRDSHLEMVSKSAQYIDRATKELTLALVDVIAFGNTSLSFLKGAKWNEEITKKIEAMTDAKVVTTCTAIFEAFEKLKIKKISIGTPYTEEMNKKIKTYCISKEIEVIEIKSINKHGHDVSKQLPSIVYHLAKSIDRDELDGIFISCTNLQTIKIIDMLEKELNKPIVTSNQATFWKALRLAKVKDNIFGYGKLLEKY